MRGSARCGTRALRASSPLRSSPHETGGALGASRLGALRLVDALDPVASPVRDARAPRRELVADSAPFDYASETVTAGLTVDA
jgi:hypothetical protein